MKINESTAIKIMETIVSDSLAVADENGVKKHKDKSGVIAIKTATAKAEQWEQPGIYLAQITDLDEAPRMGCGVMEIANGGTLEWTLTYDEYDYVVDGILQIEVDGRTMTGLEGDIIYIPSGTHVIFKSPSSTRYAYFSYPANAVEEIL